MSDVLRLRKRLRLFEAAGLLSGNLQQIIELMREAIEDGELTAIEVVRHNDYSGNMGTFIPGDVIDDLQTFIERVGGSQALVTD